MPHLAPRPSRPIAGRRLARTAAPALAVVAALAVGGCGTSDDPAAADDGGTAAPTSGSPSDSPSDSSTEPFPAGLSLVSASEPGGASMQALVSGELGARADGCVTIGGRLLMAPFGSRVLDDETVLIKGLGEHAIGDVVEGGGGFVDIDPPTADDDLAARVCLRDARPTPVAVLTPG